MDTKNVTLRLPVDLTESLERAAQVDDRSVNKLITLILKAWIAQNLK